MSESRDLRLVQLARILESPGIDEAEARAAISGDPTRFAAALLAEAADNDDVTSSAAAMDYLETRLAFFGDLAADAAAVREAFAHRVAGWDRPPEPQ
jgi:hypothetical protein